jgi:hypothetical protein
LYFLEASVRVFDHFYQRIGPGSTEQSEVGILNEIGFPLDVFQIEVILLQLVNPCFLNFLLYKEEVDFSDLMHLVNHLGTKSKVIHGEI